MNEAVIKRLTEASRQYLAGKGAAPESVVVTGAGYDEAQRYHWVRTKAQIGGREWHDLVRKSAL